MANSAFSLAQFVGEECASWVQWEAWRSGISSFKKALADFPPLRFPAYR